MICTHAMEGDADAAFALLGHLEETEIPVPWTFSWCACCEPMNGFLFSS